MLVAFVEKKKPGKNYLRKGEFIVAHSTCGPSQRRPQDARSLRQQLTLHLQQEEGELTFGFGLFYIVLFSPEPLPLE